MLLLLVVIECNVNNISPNLGWFRCQIFLNCEELNGSFEMYGQLHSFCEGAPLSVVSV